MSEKRFTCGIDIGSKKHNFVLLDEKGIVIDKKIVKQDFDAFNDSIELLKEYQKKNNCVIEIGIEGKNGYGSPYDRLIITAGFKMYNIDSIKLKKFREIYGANDKTDYRDAHMLALLLKSRFNLTSEDEQPFEMIKRTPVENEKIKQISRFLQDLTEEKTRNVNRLIKYLNSFCPVLLTLGNIQNKANLNFLEKYSNPSTYLKLTLLKLKRIDGIGEKKAQEILNIVKNAKFDTDLADTTSTIILSLIKRIKEIIVESESLENKLETLGEKNENAKHIKSVSGFGTILASRFIGEIGNIDNFSNESKLAAYCGVVCLNNDSGESKGTKKIKRCNKICKDTIIRAAFLSIRYNKENEKYYLKKRSQYGNRKGAHLHALRCLARQMIKVIFRILKEDRDYKIKDDAKKIMDDLKKIAC